MNTYFLKYKILFFLILLLTQVSHSQLSKTHYIPPLTASENGNANPDDQYLYISTPSVTDVAVTIKPVGLSSSGWIERIVSNTNPQKVNLGSGFGQLFIPPNSSCQKISSRGYIIEATDLIYVSVRMNAGSSAQAGALVSKGLAALGTEFRVGAFTNQNPQNNYLSFVSIMATEDDTTVRFDDLPAGLVVENYSGSFPINTPLLNKGESYTLAVNSSLNATNKDGLIGALVSANKPIVVNCGSANGSFHNGNGRDYGVDQIVGADKIGTEYIFVKGDGENAWENVLIVAHEDNTSIYINGNTTAETTINAGNYHLIEGDKYNTNGNMYVKTSKPTFAYQGVGATNSEANQGLFFVPPLDCETRGNVDNITQINTIGNTNYQGGITIVTKVGATTSINGTPITQTAYPVSGKPTYVTYKVLGLTNNITVQCNDELYCAYFNYNGAATSGSFYSGFPTAPEISFDTNFVTLGNCIDNITLKAANMSAFESIEWYYNDESGSGFIATGVTSQTLTPTFPGLSPFNAGTYKVVGITCKGDKIYSNEIPISICPDDTDNDGIIDNIDIDNDNDGILNCTESYGNQVINLTNPSNGSLPIGGYTYSGNVTPIGASSNSIIGAADGTFKSTVASKSSLNYELLFNKNLNIKVELATNSTLGNSTLTNEDEFIIQVTNNKTITLIDPDDQLLIDTDFDGIYESGITQFTSFKIHFKIKNTSLTIGSGTFNFVSSMVNSFTYTHKNISNTNSNTAAFKVTATCVPLNSDTDGNNDDFDNDSDNDGIPDIVENGGSLVTLSNIDVDANGLDDVFTSTEAPIDTDNDGVPDFYDLDSDNDGIYDLIETGQLGLLSDTDLNGIVDGPAYGLNGWADAAETTTDSGIIGYLINDADADGIFSYRDLDSDGDNCNDVIEAGFSDGNNNDHLGDTTPIVNSFGVVTNAPDGYSTPNSNYLTTGLITIISQPIDSHICELDTTKITIETNTVDSYQWQVSTDGTNWSDIVDNLVYSNATTNELTLTAVPLTYHNYKYRVVLEKNGNACGLISNEVTLTVNPKPVINSSVKLTQCDDDSNDGKTFFNLNESNILVMPNSTVETFTFYTSQTAAETNNTNFLITNTTNYEATDGATVFSRISSFGCFGVAEITLLVEPTQLNSSFQKTFSQCDDYIDDVNNNRDGIATFNFSSVTNQIYTELSTDASRVTVKYYENQEDALAEENEIDPSNYRNTNYPILPPITSHQIYVRIDSNNGNACIGLGPHITLNVEALPVANPVTIKNQCDDDADGMFPFNVSTIESQVLMKQKNVTVSYVDENGNALPSPLPNPFLTTSQTITIRVQNNTTQSPDGPCYDETTLEFIVDKSPIAFPVTVLPVCDDESNDGQYAFDTSTIESTILGTQTGMEVHYFDQLGKELPSPLPNPFTSTTQTITAQVVNPLNTVCTASTTFDFIVNPLPNFNINTPDPLCANNSTSVVTLSVSQENLMENLSYEWRDANGLLSNAQSIEVSTVGTYFITLTKNDGTNCSRTKEVEVINSEKASINLGDITVVDDSNNNTITINTTNLGAGDYEFSLDDKDFGYQDEPFFEAVKAGIHTVFIRDKNNCGIAQIEVSVIGYPKFFTPNGDGFNDTWTILGLNDTIYPKAKIYIFDRFGKLITSITSESNGWDGSFKGHILPSTDYWFTAELTNTKGETKIRKGHFSLIRR